MVEPPASDRRRTTSALAAVAMALAVAGCEPGARGGTYEAADVRTLQEPRANPGRRLTEAERLRAQMPAPAGPRAGAPGAAMGLAWDLPAGWTEKPPSAMRQGDFRVEAQPEVECFITVSPGDGGGLAANVDRWRKQMGLGPLAPGDADSLPRVPVLGSTGPYVDLRGSFSGMGGGSGREGWRMLTVVGALPAVTVFVKMTGPDAAVALERERFLALAASLRPGPAPATHATDDDGGLPAGHPPVDGLPAGHPPVDGGTKPPAPAAPDAPFRWTAPAGWTEAPARSMRVVTLRPAGSTEAECYVTVLGGDGGGLAGNVNRWLGQVGLPALDDAGLAALPTVQVLGGPATLVEGSGEFAGMGGDAKKGFGLLGVIRLLGADSVFVKMTGPADLVRAERARFLEFCASLKR